MAKTCSTAHRQVFTVGKDIIRPYRRLIEKWPTKHSRREIADGEQSDISVSDGKLKYPTVIRPSVIRGYLVVCIREDLVLYVYTYLDCT